MRGGQFSFVRMRTDSEAFEVDAARLLPRCMKSTSSLFIADHNLRLL
jgi:hypothetical protein